MTSPTTPEPAGSVTLAIAGDVMLGRLVNDMLREHGWGHPWQKVAPLLWSADAFLVNLECALTPRVVRWHDGHYKPFHFRADPGAVETLRQGRVDFASLANNHICDFGPDGLLDTIAALDGAGIAHAGAGRDLTAARAPAVLNVRGVRVAVVAFADYPEAWAATEAPGLNFIGLPAREEAFEPIAAEIAAARSGADLVVFSIHWGPNMRERPPEEFRHFAHRVIDAGATVFWGHSAHLVQGIEFRDRGVILYDTGDFVDDYAVDEHLRNDLGALFLVHVRPGAVDRVELVPVRIGWMQVDRAIGEDREWFLNRLELLNRELGTAVIVGNDGSVHVAAAPHVIPNASSVT
jgi:poly-gamma-glutamate synthesis protein (capsule biosynthesis protein)